MTVLPTICSTVRRWTLSCGLTSQSRSGRVLPSSFSYSEKNSVKPGHTLRLAPWSIVRGLCTGGPLSPWGFVQVAPLTSLSAVVSGHRQWHCDSLLLVTPLGTQPPLPSPPRGAPSVASSHALLPEGVHPLKHHQTHVRGQAWVRRLVVLVVFNAAMEEQCLCQQSPGYLFKKSPRRQRTLRRRRLRKLALNSGTTRRSAKNGLKSPINPFIAAITAMYGNPVLHAVPVSVAQLECPQPAR